MHIASVSVISAGLGFHVNVAVGANIIRVSVACTNIHSICVAAVDQLVAICGTGWPAYAIASADGLLA